ncbi:unnamed protein product [Pedinophyceae sp. YPF-701]|nr:unnamed protein product [Pedinophyceae sp. YPF-701]
MTSVDLFGDGRAPSQAPAASPSPRTEAPSGTTSPSELSVDSAALPRRLFPSEDSSPAPDSGPASPVLPAGPPASARPLRAGCASQSRGSSGRGSAPQSRGRSECSPGNAATSAMRLLGEDASDDGDVASSAATPESSALTPAAQLADLQAGGQQLGTDAICDLYNMQLMTGEAQEALKTPHKTARRTPLSPKRVKPARPGTARRTPLRPVQSPPLLQSRAPDAESSTKPADGPRRAGAPRRGRERGRSRERS